MKPARFEYLAPATIQDALGLLARHGENAKVIAGGQSLVPLMNLRLLTTPFLLDITRIDDLAAVAVGEDGLTLGAGVRQADAEDDERISEAVPLVAEALPYIAHREIRNLGTVCGSLAHADPAAELPCVALATDAEMVARSVRGERSIAAREFFTGFLTTALAPDELLVAVRFPTPRPQTGAAFVEVAPRPGDYALAGVAASVTMANGTVGEARIAFAGVDSAPVRGSAGERTIVGADASAEAIAEASEAAVADLRPPADVHGTSAFRKHLAAVLTRRALGTAISRARGKDLDEATPAGRGGA